MHELKAEASHPGVQERDGHGPHDFEKNCHIKMQQNLAFPKSGPKLGFWSSLGS